MEKIEVNNALAASPINVQGASEQRERTTGLSARQRPNPSNIEINEQPDSYLSNFHIFPPKPVRRMTGLRERFRLVYPLDPAGAKRR